MKKTIVVIMLTLCVLAQAKFVRAGQVPPPKQSVSGVLASREDVDRATRQALSAIRKYKQDLEKSTEVRLRIEREVTQKQNEEIANEQRKQIENLAQAQKNSEEMAKAEALRITKERDDSNRIFAISLIVLMLISVGIIAYIIDKSNSKEYNVKEVKVIPSVFTEPSVAPVVVPEYDLAFLSRTRLQINNKTDLISLRNYVEENRTLLELYTSNGVVDIPCLLELPFKEGSSFNGMKFTCTVSLEKDGKASVRFDEEVSTSYSWKNRNVGAANIAANRRKVAV